MEGLVGLHRNTRAATLAVMMVFAGAGLSGCFDVVQKVGIGRDGSGRYQVAVSGQGVVGDALKNEKLVNRQNRAATTTSDINGQVTRMATVDFAKLSELAFSDETMSLNVTSRDFFGLGPSHVVYTARLMIGKAKNEDKRTAAANGIGEEVAKSVMGDHTYTFAVTVPGDIERALPVTLGDTTYEPTVTGDFYNGRVVTWRLPLYAFVTAQTIDFEVDFWAWGFFSNAKSQSVAND
jgi:hypothetical protein